MKAIWKGWKSGLFVNFGQIPFSWIRIPESKIKAGSATLYLDPEPV
jgi:hypothetical protein